MTLSAPDTSATPKAHKASGLLTAHLLCLCGPSPEVLSTQSSLAGGHKPMVHLSIQQYVWHHQSVYLAWPQPTVLAFSSTTLYFVVVKAWKILCFCKKSYFFREFLQPAVSHHSWSFGVEKLLCCNLWNHDFDSFWLPSLYLFMMNVLCMKEENVDQGDCMVFVSIMHAYHNHSKIMH